jgi:pimeloyl-ACP methyl ester carboxylesterase
MLLNFVKLGQGKPLVVLHGLFGSLDNWMSVGRKLSIHRTVYLVDLRNHGASFHHQDFDCQTMAGDLRSLLDHLDLTEIELIGHSMGGKVAMFYAADHSLDIGKMIIADIGPKQYPVHHDHIISSLQSIDPSSCSSRGEADQQLSQYISEKGTRQFLLKNLKRNSDGQFEWKMNLPVISKNIHEVGQELAPNAVINTPTLFIRGGRSDYIVKNDYPDIHRQFPSSEIIAIPSAGHWVHAEAPQEFLQLAENFLLQ